jgi:hypothetical protein
MRSAKMIDDALRVFKTEGVLSLFFSVSKF